MHRKPQGRRKPRKGEATPLPPGSFRGRDNPPPSSKHDEGVRRSHAFKQKRREGAPDPISALQTPTPVPPAPLPSFAEAQRFRALGEGGNPHQAMLRRRAFRWVDPVGYPMLYPVVPVTHGGLIRLRRELRRSSTPEGEIYDLSPHFLRECLLHRNLAERLLAVPEKDRPSLLVDHMAIAYDFGSAASDEIYQRFIDHIGESWELVEYFLTKALSVRQHEELHALFTGDGRANTSRDPVELFLHCTQGKVVGTTKLAQAQSFEMRRALVLAQELMRLALGPVREERRLVVESRFTKLLEERFFVPGVAERVEVHAAIEERTGWPYSVLAERENPPPGTRRRTFAFFVRYFRYGSKLYPVFFDPGQKNIFDVLLKMLANSLREPEVLPDLYRFRMVCRNFRELAACLHHMHETVFPVGGTAHSYDSNLWAFRPADSTNGASSPEFRLVKADHWLWGEKLEGQYMTLETYIRSLTSKGSDNYAAYKRRRLGRALPLLFPRSIYDVHWEAEAHLEGLATAQGR